MEPKKLGDRIRKLEEIVVDRARELDNSARPLGQRAQEAYLKEMDRLHSEVFRPNYETIFGEKLDGGDENKYSHRFDRFLVAHAALIVLRNIGKEYDAMPLLVYLLDDTRSSCEDFEALCRSCHSAELQDAFDEYLIQLQENI